MKNPKGLIIAIIIIAAPIVWFCIRLSSIKAEYPISGDVQNIQNNIEKVVNEEVSNASASGESVSKKENNASGDSEGSNFGNPISKVIENAKINVTSANVYQQPDDTSSLVGAVYKDMVVTVQDYPNGWSNIKYGEGSGWIKSDYVTKPDDGTSSNGTLVSAVGKTATIICDALNVRESGAADAKRIDTVYNGDSVNIIGANDGETWYQIQYGTKSGWISASKSLVKVNY